MTFYLFFPSEAELRSSSSIRQKLSDRYRSRMMFSRSSSGVLSSGHRSSGHLSSGEVSRSTSKVESLATRCRWVAPESGTEDRMSPQLSPRSLKEQEARALSWPTLQVPQERKLDFGSRRPLMSL